MEVKVQDVLNAFKSKNYLLICILSTLTLLAGIFILIFYFNVLYLVQPLTEHEFTWNTVILFLLVTVIPLYIFPLFFYSVLLVFAWQIYRYAVKGNNRIIFALKRLATLLNALENVAFVILIILLSLSFLLLISGYHLWVAVAFICVVCAYAFFCRVAIKNLHKAAYGVADFLLNKATALPSVYKAQVCFLSLAVLHIILVVASILLNQFIVVIIVQFIICISCFTCAIALLRVNNKISAKKVKKIKKF
ncbi:MAG: hypothetical protein E7370_04445 [Clostridiales bacterium]|nr:hypothetical protein [Clostridiales bacterium]